MKTSKDELKRYYETKLNHSKATIRSRIRHMIGVLQLEIDTIDNKDNYNPNCLGILQSSGALLDNEVGKYSGIKECLELLKECGDNNEDM